MGGWVDAHVDGGGGGEKEGDEGGVGRGRGGGGGGKVVEGLCFSVKWVGGWVGGRREVLFEWVGGKRKLSI